MQRRILFTVIIFSIFSGLIISGCSKLDTTTIGDDLLPAVDNVHTFADTLSIISAQGIFNDTTYVGKGDDHVLGAINNDPLFGTTNANVYLQLKPQFFPYYFGNPKDTLNGFGAGLDSVVLCFKYKAFWGDSAQPVGLEVREVNDLAFRDSIKTKFQINYKPNIGGTVLGKAQIDVRRIADTVKYTNRRDYSVNTVRIKLDQSSAWLNQLYARDTSANPANNAFRNDSIYRQFYNGLAVVATNGNCLMYVNLLDTSTKLEVHFRRRNAGSLDTVYNSFRLFTNTGSTAPTQPWASTTANYIKRDRTGASISSPASGELYLQTSPGSFVNLNIPGLSALDNRVIHRAELIIQQIPSGNTALDAALSAPAFLYVDLKDTGVANVWKPIYYDLNPSASYDPDTKLGYGFLPTQFDYATFGGYRRDGKDKFGNAIKFYNINISRYVQQMVTKHTPNYTLRLFAPYELIYPNFANASYPAYYTPYGNNLAAGRVKIGGGNNPNYTMRLRIIYSKL